MHELFLLLFNFVTLQGGIYVAEALHVKKNAVLVISLFLCLDEFDLLHGRCGDP